MVDWRGFHLLRREVHQPTMEGVREINHIFVDFTGLLK